MKRYMLSLSAFLAAQFLFAQVITTETAQQLLDRRGEVYFRFTLGDLSLLQGLSGIISVDNLKHDTVYAYANQSEFNRFTEKGIPFEALTPPSELEPVQMADNASQVFEWNYYPTYPEYESIMAQFAADHPGITQLVTIGTLASGRKILALRITDNPSIQENEPEFLYTSSIHGDETTGYPMMLHLIDYLLSNYGTDDRVTTLVNSIDLYINPLANPDGTYKGGNNSVNGATRGNANNIDLNRNYPDPEDGPHPDGNTWQPETVAFINFSAARHLVMSANFHGGTEVLNYPWDTWARLHADNSWWIYVCREYADTVHLHSPSNYMTFMDNGITNGYAWYTISGGRQDYHTYFRKGRECTMEISDTKLLPASQLLAHWNYNWRSLLNYLQQSTYGLHGTVTDSVTGTPLNARVFIAGHDADSSQVTTDPDAGDYHRLIKAGTYNVTFSAAGYFPKTITAQVTDKQTTVLNVQLYDGSLASNFTADTTSVAVDGTVHFTDQTAGSPQTWAWEFEQGTPPASPEQNPVVTYSLPGIYNVKLTTTRPGSSNSVTKTDYIEVKPWYLMGDKSYAVCNGQFFDAGGPGAPYADNQSQVITFYPATTGNRLKVTFSALDIQPGSNCAFDALTAYDGPNTSSGILGSWCGTDLPPVLISGNPDNAITFSFQSDGTLTRPGWSAQVECISNVGIPAPEEAGLKCYPNPSSDGMFTVTSPKAIDKIAVTDLSGRVLYESEPGTGVTTLNFENRPGVYVLRVFISGNQFNFKILVTR